MLPVDEAIPELTEESKSAGKGSKSLSTSGGMADAPDLGSGGENRESSSLSSCTLGVIGARFGGTDSSACTQLDSPLIKRRRKKG
jgi:hypothetical protein